MIFSRFLISFLPFLFLYGCFFFEERHFEEIKHEIEMHLSWHIEDVISHWGVPDVVRKIREKEYYTWIKEESYTKGGPFGPYGRDSFYEDPFMKSLSISSIGSGMYSSSGAKEVQVNLVCKITLRVNADGIVENYSLTGNGCKKIEL